MYSHESADGRWRTEENEIITLCTCRSISSVIFPVLLRGHSLSPVLCPYALHLQHCMTLTSLPSGIHSPFFGAFFKNSLAAAFSGRSGMDSSGGGSNSSSELLCSPSLQDNIDGKSRRYGMPCTGRRTWRSPFAAATLPLAAAP